MDQDNLRLHRMSEQDPSILMALTSINSKLDGIERLEKKLEEVTLNFTGELDMIKMELINLTKATNNDSVEINRLQSLFKGVSKDLNRTQENQEDFQMKLEKLVNASKENSEKIDKLERSNAKLSDNMKLLKEREN